VEKIPIHLFPCVLKPLDGSQGAGVYVNLSSYTDLARAMLKASKITRLPLIVEQQIPGDDVRLLVCRGELLVAVRRARPSVVGDGINSVARLVEMENSRRSGLGSDIGKISGISLNEEAIDYLLTLGINREYVPREGEKIYVRGTPHGTHGGLMVNVTDEVHPEIVSMAILASERIGGALCGLDYISNDHTQSPYESGGVFLEINTFPGLKPIELLNTYDQLECMRKILGRAAVPLDIAVYVGQTQSELQDLKSSVLDAQTAWYCDGQLGYGLAIDTSERPAVSVSVAYERCMLDSRAHRLVFLLTSTEVERAGLPCGRIKKSVVLDPANVSEQVRELLKRCSDGYEESSSN
jgi:cyanophycin synthetase